MGSSTWWDGRRGIARSDYRHIREKTSLGRAWRRRAARRRHQRSTLLVNAWPDAVGGDERRENCANHNGQQNDPRLHGTVLSSRFREQPGRVTRVVAQASDVATY